MPVIVLVGAAQRFANDLKAYFSTRFTVVEMRDAFKATRSVLASQDENVLYIVPGLNKPERYEIFCLSRKNNQQFVTVVDENQDESSTSDKNVLRLGCFDGDIIEKKLKESRITQTTANRRSKGVSLKSISEVKSVVNRVNATLENSERVRMVLNECEERVLKMWSFNLQVGSEEVEECYRKLVEERLNKLES